MAYARRISLAHVGLDVMFSLQCLYLQIEIQDTATKVPFTSVVSFSSEPD